MMELSFAVKDFIAGGIAGSAGVLAGQPLDTVRVRIQQENSSNYGNSMLGCWRQTIKREGFFGLYRGVSYPLFTIAFQNAIVFQAYGMASRRLKQHDTSTINTMISGMFAGLVQSFIICPIDILKIRLQIQQELPNQKTYVGAIPMLRKVIRQEGIQGLYRGMMITAIRDTPSFGMYFAVYESFKGNGSPREVLLAGGLAGVLSWGAVYPFDVVKSRVQSNQINYVSWYQCLISSYQKEGIGVFVRGLDACLWRAFLVNAVIFFTYEASLSVMNTKKLASSE